MYKLSFDLASLEMYLETLEIKEEVYVVVSEQEPCKIEGEKDGNLLLSFNGNIIPFKCFDGTNESEIKIFDFNGDVDTSIMGSVAFYDMIKTEFVGTRPVRRPNLD